MSSIRQARHRFFLVGALAFVVILTLAACGTNTGAGSGSGKASSSPTVTASQVGCPDSTVMNTTPSPANIVLKPSNSNSTITAQVGNVIEVDLPFGQRWSGPLISQGGLSLQQPAGFALTTTKMCVWRFTAQSAGTTQLKFTGQAICGAKQACPLYIMLLPYTIVVK